MEHLSHASSITAFTFDNNEVRAIIGEDGEPWLIAKDVCRVLEISNHNDALSRLDDDEKDGVGLSKTICTNVILQAGGSND